MTWKTAYLEDVCQIKGGKRLPHGHDLVDEVTSHPYIRARDIRDGNINFTEPKYITEDTFNKISRYTIKTGDVIVTIVGANIGDIAYVNEKFSGANLTENAVKLSANKDVLHPQFLKYVLLPESMKQYFQQVSSGAAQGKLGLYKIKKARIPLPSLPIQEKIASLLAIYDDLIDKNLSRIKLLEQIAQNTYEEWFVRFRYPNYEHEIFDSELGLPKGWLREPLSNHVTLLRGIEPGSSNYYEKPFDDCVPFLRVGDLNKRSSTIYVKKEIVSKKICSESDVLISMDGSPGVVSMGLAGAYSTGIRKAVIKNEKFSNAYIYAYLKSSYIQKLIFSHATGATILHAGSSVEHMEILCPPLETLDKFDHIATACFNAILNFKQQIKLLTEARDILLPRLISGAIDVDAFMKDFA
jgi:type I restriction enzyme, S subunit